MKQHPFWIVAITLGLLSVGSYAFAASWSSTEITIEQAVHFITTDGNDVVVDPGTYEMEGLGEELRLTSKEGPAPITIQAGAAPFPEKVESPVAMAIPIPDEGIYLALAIPGGAGLEAMGSFSPVQKRGIGLVNTPRNLTSQNIRQLKSFAKRLADDPDSKTLKNDWTQVVKKITRQKALRNSTNVHAMVMMVMRDSIVDQNQTKQYFLEKLQQYNAMGKELSQYLEDLHRKAKNLRGAKKVQIKQLIHTKENELQKLGNDAQLANVDLQNTLQKLQQTLQMMSNISKMLHDTAMSVIRKIGCEPGSTC